MLGHLASAVSSFLLLYSSYSYQVSAFVVHNYYPGNTCCTSYTHSSLLVGATYDQSILDETQEQQTQTKTQQKKRILSPSSSISKSWLRRYEELKSFKEKNGHCNVSRHENAIGNWVQKQRSGKKVKRNYMCYLCCFAILLENKELICFILFLFLFIPVVSRIN